VFKLKDKVVIITGAASGIGASCAQLFYNQGACVALLDIDNTGLHNIQLLLDPTLDSARLLTINTDVTQIEQIRNAVQYVVDTWGQIDVLLPCTGISVGGTVTTIDEKLWDKVFDVNVKGTYFLLHEAIPYMVTNKSGSIILVGSQLVESSAGNNAAYIASKGAIATLAKTMAVDYAKDGIRVNVLMPGVIDTPMSQNSLKRFDNPEQTKINWANRHAMKRIGQPDEVAKAALFLASDDSSFTTGSKLFCDGGWSAM